MNYLVRIAALLLMAPVMAPTAWAASPFLPISATNTFRSGERAIVEQAITQAETEGKLVLIDMAAAWCGPCFALEKDMEAKKAKLQPTLDHFVYVKLEEMHLEMMAGADFISHEIPWFPSLYVYNPANQKWSFLYINGADSLQQTLEDYMANDGVSGFYLKNVMTKIQSGATLELDEILQALIPMSVEDTGANLMTAVAAIQKAVVANPKQFSFSASDLQEMLEEAYKRSIERGQLTLEQVRATDAGAFAGLEADPIGAYRMFFVVPIGQLIRTQGNKAASDQCPALATAAAEYQKSMPVDTQHEFKLRYDMQCLLLKVQLKEALGSDVATYVATMSDAERAKFSYSLMRVYAATGTNFQEAIDAGQGWRAAYEKNYSKNADLLARVIAATDARFAAYAAGKSHP